MAKQPGREQSCGGYVPPGHDPTVAPMDSSNLPQQFSLLDRRIILAHAVATRDQKVFFADAALAYDAMNKETFATSVEHEIACLYLLETLRLNGETIAGPQGRQHADSAGSQL